MAAANVRIVGISGSLRRGSFNTSLLHAAAEVAPAGATIDVRTIHGIPLYDADVENGPGIPDAVKILKDDIASSDGLLLVTPEYNNSLPGVFKNAIDWLSRPDSDIARIFRGRPVAIIGASPGRFGTTLSQAAWLPVIRTLGMRPWFDERLLVFEAGKNFDATGKLTDVHTRERMVKFVAGYCAFVAASASLRPA
ncbi:MAG: NADPH-dependent FMN reductase [Gammaproteobacteria bacterium]